MRLHTYFRSSASYRVRIALGLKGIAYSAVTVSLPEQAHRYGNFLRLNPQGLLPVLELEEGALTQSLAILDYLEEVVPQPPLLATEPFRRARMRAACQLIACDIHPLNNLRVLNYLKTEIGLEQESVDTWYRHWIASGFDALEAELANTAGVCAFGDTPSLVDVCLVPQMYNARRFETDLSPYLTLCRVDEHLQTLPAFAAAAPDVQPDS